MKTRTAVSIGFISMVLLFLIVSPVQAANPGRSAAQAIINGDPLTILVSSDGTIQIFHNQDLTHGAVYEDISAYASGLFIAFGTDVYGPFIPAWGENPIPTPMIEVEHEGPFGAGTEGDPFQIITTLEAADEDYGIRVEQIVSYVDGQEFFQIDWDLTNIGKEEVDFKFYHAADIYFAGTDQGFGYYKDGVVGGYNWDRDWYMAFDPLTPADHYQEDEFIRIWQTISTGLDLMDGTVEDYVDNGIALQWDINLGARESTTISDLWRFGDMPPVGGGVDVWLKDSPEDDGSVPSSNNNTAWWTSTDIIVRNQWDDEMEHQNPIADQENYIYVYVRNQGIEDAEDVVVNVYYADANQLSPRWPDSFSFIDSVLVDVPAGGELWTEAIPWVPPVSGHLCLYVRLESEQDPIQREGNVPGDNNIAQRNIHVIDLQPSGGSTGDTSVNPILSNPSTDPDDQIDLVLRYPDIPDTLRIIVILPDDLFEGWQALGGYVDGGTVIDTGQIEVDGWEETIIYNLPILPLEEAQITIRFEGSVQDPFMVGAIERLNGEDIGGNVYYYQGLMPTPTPEYTPTTPVNNLGGWITANCCLVLGILAVLAVVVFLTVFFIVKGKGKQKE